MVRALGRACKRGGHRSGHPLIESDEGQTGVWLGTNAETRESRPRDAGLFEDLSNRLLGILGE